MDSYISQKGADQSSLRNKVFQTLRENILSGEYNENEELKEVTLGQELGVSRTPVREALRQLELEGLVHIVPNKGAYVTGITPKDVKDIYMVRSLLEGLCARWATEYITEEQLSELEGIILLTDFYAQKGNFEQVYELDGRFHEMLYEASNSKMLDHILTDFHRYVQRIRKITMSRRTRASESTAEHHQILDAIREKDADKAEHLANQHILNAMQNMESYGIENLLNKNQEEAGGRTDG